jgi:hypothetical protein
MTKLKINVALADSCALTITDASGFFDDTTNVNGFLLETDSSDLTLNTYKISQGWFLNVLLYNKYAATPIISNPSDTFYNVPTGVVDNNTYANNFIPSIYQLIQDGTYTIKRFFIPSLEFYTANSDNSIFDGVDMYYTDGDQIYFIISGTPTVISILDLLNANLLTSNCISTSATFVSTCYTNQCYFKILSTLLEIGIGACSYPDQTKYNTLLQSRDLLYMTLEIIKYLKDVNNITQIQKLIEVVDICGGVCASTLNTTSSTNCGCNG